MGIAAAQSSRRTTVSLSPESRLIVERYKLASGISTSSAIDQLIQKSEPKPSRLKNVNGFLILDEDAEGRHFIPEDLKSIEDEIDDESIQQVLTGKKKSARRKRNAGKRQ